MLPYLFVTFWNLEWVWTKTTEGRKRNWLQRETKLDLPIVKCVMHFLCLSVIYIYLNKIQVLKCISI